MGQNLTRMAISIEELIRFIMMLFISINYQLEKVTFFGSVFMRITQVQLKISHFRGLTISAKFKAFPNALA